MQRRELVKQKNNCPKAQSRRSLAQKEVPETTQMDTNQSKTKQEKPVKQKKTHPKAKEDRLHPAQTSHRKPPPAPNQWVEMSAKTKKAHETKEKTTREPKEDVARRK